MKLLQISEADLGGGAERIAYDLHRSSLAKGHASRMLVGYKRSGDGDITGLVPEKGPGRLAYRCARALERRSGMQAQFYWMAGSWLRKNVDGLDIVHLHNLHGKYFNLGVLPFLATHAQIVFTLHDCWPFTGHCAHIFDCTRWTEHCHPCCDIKRYPDMDRDAARYNLARKKLIFARTRPVLVAPSRWLRDLVQRSEIFRGFDCRAIYNGIDHSSFCPGNKLSARARLHLPADKHIVLFVANGGLNSTLYKDTELLLAAVERLMVGPLSGKFQLVVIGGTRKIPGLFDSCILQIDDTREGLETFYQAADLLAYPTKADNCPLVPMEAMSCGLPVVSTRIGGMPEVVEQGVTGYLLEPGDVQGFARCVEAILGDRSSLKTMGAAAAERAKLRFTLDRMTSSYFALYQELSQAHRQRNL